MPIRRQSIKRKSRRQSRRHSRGRLQRAGGRRSKKSVVKKSRRRGMRGGCWLTDMFMGSSKPEENVVARALRNQARVQQEINTEAQKTKKLLNTQNKGWRTQTQNETIKELMAKRQQMEIKQRKRKWARETIEKLPIEVRVNLRDQKPNVVAKWLKGEADMLDKEELDNVLGYPLKEREFYP